MRSQYSCPNGQLKTLKNEAKKGKVTDVSRGGRALGTALHRRPEVNEGKTRSPNFVPEKGRPLLAINRGKGGPGGMGPSEKRTIPK